MTKLMPWVGGKAQLMWAIQMLLPTHYKTLVDVFGGSGIRPHWMKHHSSKRSSQP